MNARKYTTDQLAAELLKYPPGTPVQSIADDGSGHTFSLTDTLVVRKAEECEQKFEPGCVVVMGLDGDAE